jgi:hypothetical protein
LGDDNVVEGRVTLAEASETDFDDHDGDVLRKVVRIGGESQD